MFAEMLIAIESFALAFLEKRRGILRCNTCSQRILAPARRRPRELTPQFRPPICCRQPMAYTSPAELAAERRHFEEVERSAGLGIC